MNTHQWYLMGLVDGVSVSYNGNIGRQPATPTPNTPIGGPYTTYNNYPTRGEQASQGLYPNSNGMTMSPDGTKVFAVNHNGSGEGFVNDSITQYNLNTPWDLLTMTARIGSSPSLNSFPSFTDGSPSAVYFSPDGLNMYVTGGSLRVFRYTLTTAYTVSTATAHSSMATGLTATSGLSFSQDGTKMFVTDSSNIVKRFLLSIAWDTTTIANDGTSLAINGTQTHFNADGLSFYSFGGGINKYVLGVPWDLNSFVKVRSTVALSTLTGVFQGGVYVNPSKNKFFMSGYTAIPVKGFDIKI